MADHGVSPLDAAATWTIDGGNAPKKQVPPVNPGQLRKKCNQNDPKIDEIENILDEIENLNLTIDYDLGLLAAHHQSITTTNIYKQKLVAFRASMEKRMMVNLALECATSAENLSKCLTELNYNIDRNKRCTHVARLITIPAAGKRQKICQKQSKTEKNSTTTTQASRIYSFIARNTMFPDPNNCHSFNPQKREENSPNLKEQIRSLNQLMKTSADEKPVALVATSKSLIDTNFPAKPRKETNTEYALKKPPNIVHHLPEKRGKGTTTMGTFATIFLQPADTSPTAHSSTVLAPRGPSLNVYRSSQSIVRYTKIKVPMKKDQNNTLSTTEKFGRAATSMHPSLSSASVPLRVSRAATIGAEQQKTTSNYRELSAGTTSYFALTHYGASENRLVQYTAFQAISIEAINYFQATSPTTHFDTLNRNQKRASRKLPVTTKIGNIKPREQGGRFIKISKIHYK